MGTREGEGDRRVDREGGEEDGWTGGGRGGGGQENGRGALEREEKRVIGSNKTFPTPFFSF